MDRRSYRKIYRRIWTHEGFVAFNHEEKLVALYLLSGPQTNRIGLFRLSCAELSEDLRLKAKAQTIVNQVCRVMDWQYDAKASVVWVPSWWSFNPPGERETNFRGMLTDINDVPRSPLLLAFCEHTVHVPERLHRYLSAWAEHEHSTASARAQREQGKGSARAQVEHISTPDVLPDVQPDVQELRTAEPPAPRFPQAVEKSEEPIPESRPPTPKSASTTEPAGDNYRPILALAHKLLEAGGIASEVDLRGAVKARCHELGIRGDLREGGEATALVRACVSAWTAHRLKLGAAS